MNRIMIAIFLMCVFQNIYAIEYQNPDERLMRLPVNGKNEKAISHSSFVNIQSIELNIKTANVVHKLKTPTSPSKSRSLKDAALFKNVSPSVVLVFTKDSLGSGSVISSSGQILTNWHVVGMEKEVNVVFKPVKDTQKISDADIRRAKVIKIDQISDLAILQVIDAPKNIKPIKLGSDSDIAIGIDVHAIGHPKGESWTYTKGVISQFRIDYEWSGSDIDIKHKANVIQTQTPINPGNSGGPLIIDNGSLIGVNSFKGTNTEGINFSVSIEDIKDFIKRASSRYAPTQSAKSNTSCEWKEIFKGKSEDGKAEIILSDSNCMGKANIEEVFPFDIKEPYYIRLDRNGDSKVDTIIYSFKRNNKWDLSYWDDDFDGVWDRVGYHEKEAITPDLFDSYSDFKTRLAKK
jgi:S1-C subfamily serine protease